MSDYTKDIRLIAQAIKRLAEGHGRSMRVVYVDVEAYLIDDPDYRDGWTHCGRYRSIRKGKVQRTMTIPQQAPQTDAYEVWLNEADELLCVPVVDAVRIKEVKHEGV